MKGRILQKLKSIPQGRILYLNASDGLPASPPPHGSTDNNVNLTGPPTPEQPVIFNAIKLMKDEKENINPSPSPNPSNKKLKTDGRFRRPQLESESLFDPDLLAAFQKAVMDHIRSLEEAKAIAITKATTKGFGAEDVVGIVKKEIHHDPLMVFEQRCPPGGEGAVVIYTTSLRGIRKTFEDCSRVRYLLQSSKVLFDERDVSMHLEFREELWRVLEQRAIPPRLFVKGRYVGGADEVLGLHEQGRLLPLLEGMPVDRSGGAVCEECAGMRFVVCFWCSGGRKVFQDESAAAAALCQHCNENGLVLCPNC